MKTRKPIFFAGLAQIEDGPSPDEPAVMVIITPNAQGGIIDVHDRRPVALSSELAREWLSPDLTKDRAKEIARDCGQPAEDFEWYPVPKDVGNVRNKGEYLIKSIT